MESQETRILTYLESGKSITPIDALNLFGCFRLSARVKHLREKGYEIITSMETKEMSDGSVKRYARYWLKEA